MSLSIGAIAGIAFGSCYLCMACSGLCLDLNEGKCCCQKRKRRRAQERFNTELAQIMSSTTPSVIIVNIALVPEAQRDIFISGLMIGIDGTNKSLLDGFEREWPDDVECTQSVVDSLKSKDVWNLDEDIYKKYQL